MLRAILGSDFSWPTWLVGSLTSVILSSHSGYHEPTFAVKQNETISPPPESFAVTLDTSIPLAPLKGKLLFSQSLLF